MAIKLCEHDDYTAITHIKEPKYSTNEILIDKEKVDRGGEHLVIRFAKEAPKEKYGWFYMSKAMVQKHRTQPNGRIQVYVVPLNKREEFIGIKNCKHLQQALI